MFVVEAWAGWEMTEREMEEELRVRISLDATGLPLVASTYNTSQFGRRERSSLPTSAPTATTSMSNSRKRKLSIATEGISSKQPRTESPIVISDDSDDDVRQISPPPLTAKQKGKRRAVPETDDLSRRLCDIDVISISDDEAPILPALSRHQTPLEVLDHQSSVSVKETPIEFEVPSEALPPDQILERFRDLFGERKCSQCEKSIQPARSPVCILPLVAFLLLIRIVTDDVNGSPERRRVAPHFLRRL